MILPPISLARDVPRRFKELVSAAQGNFTYLIPVMDFFADIVIRAPRHNSDYVDLPSILNGFTRIELLSSHYLFLKNFRLDDLLYYLRLLFYFGVLDIEMTREIPRDPGDIVLRRTALADVVYDAVERREAVIVYSLYMGLLFKTPARNVFFSGIKASNIVDLVYIGLLNADIVSRALGIQVVNRNKLIGISRSTTSKPWYEPISDISGIIALLAALQIVKIRPRNGKLIGLRYQSRLRREIMVSGGVYGDYILPRGSMIIELDWLVNRHSRDELTGVDYSEFGGVVSTSIDWFKSKLPYLAFSSLKKVADKIVASRRLVEEQLATLYRGIGSSEEITS